MTEFEILMETSSDDFKKRFLNFYADKMVEAMKNKNDEKAVFYKKACQLIARYV